MMILWSVRSPKDALSCRKAKTIISDNVFNKLCNDKSVCEWIYDAVSGRVQKFGLELPEQ